MKDGTIARGKMEHGHGTRERKEREGSEDLVRGLEEADATNLVGSASSITGR